MVQSSLTGSELLIIKDELSNKFRQGLLMSKTEFINYDQNNVLSFIHFELQL